MQQPQAKTRSNQINFPEEGVFRGCVEVVSGSCMLCIFAYMQIKRRYGSAIFICPPHSSDRLNNCKFQSKIEHCILIDVTFFFPYNAAHSTPNTNSGIIIISLASILKLFLTRQGRQLSFLGRLRSTKLSEILDNN